MATHTQKSIYHQSDWAHQLDLMQNPTREQLVAHASKAPADEREGELFKYLNTRIEEMPVEAQRRRIAMR
jgi:hypothetical protein